LTQAKSPLRCHDARLSRAATAIKSCERAPSVDSRSVDPRSSERMKPQTIRAEPARHTSKRSNLRTSKNQRPTARAPFEARSTFVAAGVLVAIVLLCYASSLSNGFVFDDHGHVLKDKLFRSLANVPRILTASYRPLRDVSYAVDFALWGERAFGFHLTSVLIHAANTVLVFLLMRRLTKEMAAGALAALVFAVHPIQTDAVAYISGRRDVLFAFFYLASFHCYLSYRRNLGLVRAERPSGGRKAIVVFVCFIVFWALSLMSKEMAASLPLFIFAWSLCDGWPEVGDSWARRLWAALRNAFNKDRWLYLALALAVPVYAWFMVFVKGGSLRATWSGFSYWGGSFYANMLTAIRVHAWYLKQLVLPTPIVQYSGAFDVATSLADWRVIVSIIVVGAVLAAGFALLDFDRLMAFAILSYFVLLLPVSQIIPHHELLADHYLYLPMMSFGLFVALAVKAIVAKWGSRKRIVYAATAAALIVLCVMTGLRNRVYKDDMTLWQANYDEVPNSIRAVSSLAALYAKSYPARAATLYKRCIEIDPSYAPAYTALAVLYQTRQGAQEVEELIVKGLALPDSSIVSPGYENPLRFRSELTTALAVAKGFQNEPDKAEQLLRDAININPLNTQPYALLAAYYHATDRSKEIEILKQQLAADPSNYDALSTLAYRLIEDKKFDEALPQLNRIVSMVPNDFRANYQLWQVYRAKKDCAAARAYLAAAASAASDADETKVIQDARATLARECK
jgi:tetratricopeptide (TPR) repeat protein